MTNVERVRHLLDLAGRMRVEELVDCFAGDAVMELPFAPGRMARRHEGKPAIADFQRFARDSFSTFSMTVDAVHETTDPHVVIAEHHSDGVVRANGRPYRNTYVTLIRFDDDGLVTNWREYYDPGVVVRAFRSAE